MVPVHFSSSIVSTNCTEVLIYDPNQGLEGCKIDFAPQTCDHLRHCIDTAKFGEKAFDTLLIPCPVGRDSNQIIILTIGKKDKESIDPVVFDRIFLEKLGAKAYQVGGESHSCALIIYPGALISLTDIPDGEVAAWIGGGIALRSWRFDQYKTKPSKKTFVPKVVVMTDHTVKAQVDFNHHLTVVQGNILTRQVVSEPPNVIYPESMANIAKELTSLGVEVKVLGQKELESLGCGALLGVAQGSVREPFLVTLHWNGLGTNPDKNHQNHPIAIVGKGVTFDSGGISIKPSNNMEDMKYDMAGSGVVVGLIKTLALQQSKVNVVGVMGLVENMPSGTAQRPSDVVKSMSGQTIEVINTDAEGRLVLADALWYVQEHFDPSCIVDLATLTGAIVVALGHEYAGLFSNNDELSQQLIDAGKKTGETVWRLPMDAVYDRDIDSDIADMKNVGAGRGAGSTTAAHFLMRFIKGKTPWAHLDIAGTAWDKKDKSLTGKGATGFGVRLLENFVNNYCENKKS